MSAKSAAVRQHLHPVPAITWVEYLPSKIRPFCYLARIHRPGGALPSFYPFAWSVSMACYAHDEPMATVWTYYGLLFVITLMIDAAGCVIDDMWDKDLDALVSRTRTRPLPAGDVSMFQAFVFLTMQVALIVWLLSHLNEYSFRLGIFALSLIVLYPTMKRVTYWPQAVLGLCMNWGVLLGAASVVGSVDWQVYMPLYLGAACWTIVSDTAYARQDRDEDIKYGVYSTTIIFGENIRPILAMFTYPFFIGATLGGVHLARFIVEVDFENRESCDYSLYRCSWFGLWVWAGALIDYVVKTQF